MSKESEPDPGGKAAEQLLDEIWNTIIRYGDESDISVLTAMGVLLRIQNLLNDELDKLDLDDDDDEEENNKQ